MNWPLVTLDHVLAHTHDARVQAVFRDQAREAQEESFRFVVSGVVARIRAKVGQRQPLDADPLRIPPEFVELAVLLCLSSLLARLGVLHAGQDGGVYTLTSEQRDRIRSAEKDLDLVAKGELSVTASDNPQESASVSSAAGVELAATPVTRVLARGSTSGL